MRARATLLAAALALACAGGAPPYELPEERTGGRPLTQAPNPRSGEISWRAGPIEKTADGLRVEFTLMNGTSRDYFNVMLRLVLRGPGAAGRDGPLPDRRARGAFHQAHPGPPRAARLRGGEQPSWS